MERITKQVPGGYAAEGDKPDGSFPFLYCVTLEDGSSYTLYGGCAASASSRSVRAVAQAAIDSGDYSDNEEALAILQGFLQ